MAPTNRRSTGNNPYRTGGDNSSPIRKPLAMGVAAVVMLIMVMIFFSGSGDKEFNSYKLRSPNNAEKIETKKTAEGEAGKRDTIQQEPVSPDIEAELTFQQEIIHEDYQRKDEQPGVKVEAMEEYEFENVRYFHHYYKQKSGAVIEDMLMAHAYAFHMNGHYGGCCAKSGTNVQRHEDLLDAIGLKEALPFKCAKDYGEDASMKKRTIGKETYHTADTRIWTPAYVAYLKSLVKYPAKNEDEFVIVAHIRRGDVTPCRVKNLGYDRYLPNKHFLDLIDLYKKPGARVEIISESESFESLDEFREKGYIVNLDEDLGEIWRTFVSADVVILSRSDFSMIPAVCAMGQVVYTPFWHPPIRGWDRVPKEIMVETDAETERLRRERC